MTEADQQKYKCDMCAYIYDPAKGHLPSGVKSHTAFDDLPGTFRCPVCGASKDDFHPVG